jgi:hypothetical protein
MSDQSCPAVNLTIGVTIKTAGRNAKKPIEIGGFDVYGEIGMLPHLDSNQEPFG